MSIGLKISPYSMQWTLRVRILQEISVGDGCDMHAVSSLVALQGRICADADENLWPDRQQRVDGQEGEGEDSDQ
jgi:hypothetical protein